MLLSVKGYLPISMLLRVQQEPDRERALAAKSVLNCKEKLLRGAPDGLPTMLHFLSPFVKIKSNQAHEWVYKQCQSHGEDSNEKLEKRYRRLMEYFDNYR